MVESEQFTCDWTSRNTAAWREHLGHLAGRPARGLEVGSYEGRSACWWLEHVLAHPDSRLTCVDVWHVPEVEARFRLNVAEFGDRVEIIKRYSAAALRELPLLGFDFAYIDGAHEGMNVLEDGVLAWRLVKVGGLLIFDDYEFTNDRRVVQPKTAIDAFISIYPAEVLYRGWQVILKKVKENHSYHVY